jgi:sodium/potassium-transporting ATPase subunit alpha
MLQRRNTNHSHPTTVCAIAQQIGITNSQDEIIVLTNEELVKLNDEELEKILKQKDKKIIFARALPEDKLRIVKTLQKLNEVVAVTGDGVNDAPALKQADVGVAMGITGTDVAKEAAEIVLLDDNFATIVNAIKQGRTVFENIKKFIIYILTSNMPEIIPFLLFVLLGWPLALPVLLILAIDLGTDMIPAISLGVEKAEQDVMKQKPRPKHTKLLTARMLYRSYGVIGPLQATISFIVFFMTLFAGGWTWGQHIAITDPLYHSAVAAFFTAIVITQIFNLISCRTMRGSALRSKTILKNKTLFLGIGTEILLILGIVFFAPIQKVFGTAPFPLEYIWIMIAGGFLILGIEELRKYINRRYNYLDVS